MKTSTTKLAMVLLALSGCTERTSEQVPAKSALDQGRARAEQAAPALQAQPQGISIATKQATTGETAKVKAPAHPAARSRPVLRAMAPQQTARTPSKTTATEEPAKTKALVSTANDSWAARQR